MQLYSGLDLHSTNTYIGILNTDFKRVFKKRISNNLDIILETLEPFRDQLKGLVVESTYNWYWLVDGLMDAGYPFLIYGSESLLFIRFTTDNNPINSTKVQFWHRTQQWLHHDEFIDLRRQLFEMIDPVYIFFRF